MVNLDTITVFWLQSKGVLFDNYCLARVVIK